MLNIILGRAGSGKTSKILEKIKSDTENHKKSYIVVPEQMTLEYEKQLTDFFDKPLFLCKIMSFERLSGDIIAKTGGQNADYIDEVGKPALLYNILGKHKDEFSLYKSSLTKKGFLQSSLKLLNDLKTYDISPDALSKVGENPDIPQNLSRKLCELSKIYNLLEQSISGRFTDNQSRLKLACEQIPDYIKSTDFNIYFDAFISFTALELNIIKNLLICGKDITITLPYSDLPDQSFAIAKNTLATLRELSQVTNTEFKSEVLETSFAKYEDIAFLESNFAAVYRQKYDKAPQNITLNIYDSPNAEIEHIANSIRGIVKKNGLKYSDIAVAVTDLKAYSEIIRDVFGMYEIPFFLDIKRDLTGENIVNLIFSLLSMFEKNLNCKNLLSTLKTGFLDVKKSAVHSLDNFMVKWSMFEKPYINEKYFKDDKYFASEFEDEKDEIIEAFEFVNTIYKKHKQNFSPKSTSSEFSKSLTNLLDELGCRQKIEDTIQYLQKENPEMAGEMSQSWNILIDTITKLDTAFGDEKTSLSDYKKMLMICLDSQKISIIPPTVDSVIVMDINSSKSVGYDVLFSAGMSDTLLPAPPQSDVFFQEKEKDLLKDCGIDINTSINYHLNMEIAAIYSILTSARKKIFLSYALTDINSTSASSSHYLENIKLIFPKLTQPKSISEISLDEKSFDIKDDFAQNLTVHSAVYHLFRLLPEKLKSAKQIPKNSDNCEIMSNMLNFCQFLRQTPQYENYYNIMKKAVMSKNEYKKITSKNVEQIYNLPLTTSVSELQSFANCPFMHFMDYLIKPQPGTPAYIDNLACGSIMHKYMENLTKSFIFKNKKISEITDDKISRIVNEIYGKDDFLADTEKIIVSNSMKQKNILENLKKISEKATEFTIREKNSGDFETTSAEYSLRPLKLKINMSQDESKNSICLHGKIDRIDTVKVENEKYIRIIDYKSSKKDLSVGDIIDATNLQLSFYLYALEQTGAGKAFSAMYLPLTDTYERIDFETMGDIRQKLRDQLKMQGLIVNNKDIFDKFEKDVDGKSSFSNISVKNENLTGKSVVTKNQMEYILGLAVRSICSVSNDMINGNIEPAPVGDICDFCSYKNICKFDSRISGYKKRKQTKVKLQDLAPKEGEDCEEGEKNAK